MKTRIRDLTIQEKQDAGELQHFKDLLQTFPKGILSVVSDTWDLWKVCTKYLPILKDEILARDGKLVIRPDSGNPVDIICGEISFSSLAEQAFHPRTKGVIELLWDVFGGTVNEQGYKVLDSHIGAIYGDSITLERAEQICERLKAKGFASTNIVLGVGSYSMGYATRDNQGGAVKSTACIINGELVEIFKDPITDDGTKKSAKGLLRVTREFDAAGHNGTIVLKDQQSLEDISMKHNMLKPIVHNGRLANQETLTIIRERINNAIKL